MPNIDFDQEPRGAADRGEHRQAAGAIAQIKSPDANNGAELPPTKIRSHLSL
jgi:hypothetical protein